MAKNPENTVTTPKRGKPVSGTVSPELHAALEDHRWDVRMTFSQLVGLALSEYATAHGVPVDEPTE